MAVYKGLFGDSESRTSTLEEARPKGRGVVPGLFGGASGLPEEVRPQTPIDIPARSLLEETGRAVFTPEIASRVLGIEGGRTPGEELQEKYAIGRKGIKADYSERFVNEFATGFMGEILDIATTPFAYLIPPIIRKGGGPIVKKLASTKIGRTTLGRIMTTRFKNNPMSKQFWDDIGELTAGRLPRAKPVKSTGGKFRGDPVAREAAIRERGVRLEVRGLLEPPGGIKAPQRAPLLPPKKVPKAEPPYIPKGVKPPKVPVSKKLPRESKQITMREDVALRERLRAEARGAKVGYAAGVSETRATLQNLFREKIENIQSVKRQIVDYAKTNLPLEQRGKLLPTVARAKTQRELHKAFFTVDRLVQRLERGDAVRELKTAFKGVDLKKIRPEYRKELEWIVTGVDPTKRTDKRLSTLWNMADYIEKQPDNQIPQKILAELKILSKTPIEQFTTEDVQEITDMVKHLARMNDLKNKLIIKGKLRKAEEIRAESIKNIGKHTEQQNESLSGLDSLQMEKEAGLGGKVYGVMSFNAELKTEILDAQDGGIIQEVLYRGIDDGVAVQYTFEHNAEDYFKEKFKGIDVDKWSRTFQLKEKNLDIVSVGLPSGRKIRMTKGERVSFYLHSLNENNKRHLLEGGYSFSGTPSKIVKLDEADLSAITKSLTPEEVTVSKAISGYLNGMQKNAINKVSVDLLGHEIAREANYFPIRTSYLDRFRDELIKSSNYSQKTLEGMGIFKERQSAKNALIIDDAFNDLYRSIKSVGSYVGLASPLRNAKMLLNDNDFQIAARNAGKNHYIKSLKKYLERVEGDAIRFDDLDKLTQDLINKLDVAILGLNPWVMLKQPISYISAGTEMDSKYLQKGGLKPGSKEELAEIKKWSPHLRDRFEGNVTREMGELAEVGRVKKFFTGKEVISNKFMAGIRAFDKTAIASIWRAVKLEVLETNPGLKGDAYFQKVAERSWEVIRRTQPTFHIKDRSEIGMSRNVMIRLLTKYSSQRNKNYMMIRRGFEKYNRSGKKPKDKADLAGTIAIITLISPLLLIATDALRDVTYGRNQKKQLFTASINFLKFNFGNIYFLGDAFSSVASKVEKGTFSGYDITNPLSSTMDETVDAIAEGVRSIQFAITQEEYGPRSKKAGEMKWKNSLRRMATGAIEIAGKLKGIPIHTVRRLLEAGVRVTKKALYGNF